MTEEEAIQDLKLFITETLLKSEQGFMARMGDEYDGADKHFTSIDRHFDNMDRRFDHLESRFDHLQDLLKRQTDRIITHLDKAHSPSIPKPNTPPYHQEPTIRPDQT